MDFLKDQPGGSGRCWDQPITVSPPLLVPPGAHSQSSPALILSVIKVSLSDRNAVKMSTVSLPCPLSLVPVVNHFPAIICAFYLI